LVVRLALGLLLTVVLAVACTSSNENECTCAVENAGARRTLVCGETSCVAGLTFACLEKDNSVARGACTEPAPTPTTTATPDAGAPPPPPDTSCEDLRAYCSSSCSKPATVSADCQSTANTGDPGTCAAWQSTNGVLCRP
jgi:hypothetical protein